MIPEAMRRRSRLLVLTVGFASVLGMPAVAHAGGAGLTPGGVFTQTNTAPTNYVRVFQRGADGTLTAAGEVSTGGAGRPVANPPLGLPFVDAAGDVELSSDGDNKRCLFVTNAGSNSVSSFSVKADGIQLADQELTNGSRPISLTSTQRGPMNRVLYVLNSDLGSASIQGYTVTGACELTVLPGSFRAVSTPTSLPAQIAFNQSGTALVVPERLGPGIGDIDVFPVGANGVAGPPVVSPSIGVTPYGVAWDSRDRLTVSDGSAPDPAASTVSSYQLAEDYSLVPINQLPSPGAACWNVITNNGKFLYISQPAGQYFVHSINVFSIGPDGALAPGGQGQNTRYNGVDEALSRDSRYLYVLSDQLIPSVPVSAIDAYSIDPVTGGLTPIGTVDMPGNSTSGLAAW